jgi:hypothetical protein
MPRRTPTRRLTRRIRATVLQPVLAVLVRRNRTARELIAAMQLPCSVCTAALSSHFNAANRWIGCRKDGGR